MSKNKKKIKQRKKKQLKKWFKQVPAKVVTQVDNEVTFETRLNKAYGGTILPLTTYINDRAVMKFKCSECSKIFFARPSYLLYVDHQKHVCNKPLTASNISPKNKKVKKN